MQRESIQLRCDGECCGNRDEGERRFDKPHRKSASSGFPFSVPSDPLFPSASNAAPMGLTFDAYANSSYCNNLYIVDQFMGRNNAMLWVSSAGVVTPLTLTWTPSRGSWNLWGAAISGSTIYLTGDNDDHCVHNGTLVSGNTLSLKVMAGTCGSSGFTDGTGAAAAFNQPQGIAVDSFGNVFVGEYGKQRAPQDHAWWRGHHRVYHHHMCHGWLMFQVQCWRGRRRKQQHLLQVLEVQHRCCRHEVLLRRRGVGCQSRRLW